MSATFIDLLEQIGDTIHSMVYKLRAGAIHLLGGYMADECVLHPDKVEQLLVTRQYAMSSMLHGRFEYNEARLKAGLMNMLIDHIRPFVVFEAYHDPATNQYVTRARLRVIRDK